MSRSVLCVLSDRCEDATIAAEALDATLVMAAFDAPTQLLICAAAQTAIDQSATLSATLASCAEFGVEVLNSERSPAESDVVLTF